MESGLSGVAQAAGRQAVGRHTLETAGHLRR